MNASPPPHPTDQILYDYGLGKLRRSRRIGGRLASGGLPGLPAAGVRAVGR